MGDNMNRYYYVYVLWSEKDGKFYVGYTKDIRRRLDEHNSGRVPSTKKRTPLRLIYWEGCLNQQDATKREKYLKTAWGKRFIKNRLKNFFMEVHPVR
jgi:putative endonuclease